MEKAMAIVRKIQKLNLRKGKDAIFTWSRAALVVPQMIGHRIAVHNGRKHLSVHITEHMVGHKLGEFSRTRTFRGHAGMKVNLQKQKKKK